MSRSLFARRAVRVLVVACALLGSVGAQAASAAILQVDDDKVQCPKAGFRTISRALAIAPAGATIVVCPGTYPEALQMTTPGVRVVGLTGNPADVVIRRPALLIQFLVDMSAPATALQGVTVQGTGGLSPHFFGVFVHEFGPLSEAAVVDNVTFRAIGNLGSAVVIGGNFGARAIVSHSRMLRAGSGIRVGSPSRVVISDNVITGPPPTDSFFAPIGIVIGSAHVRVVRNDISGFITDAAPHEIDSGNVSAGIGVFAQGFAPNDVGGAAAGTGNRIHDNALGVLVATQGATIANNILRDNFVAGLIVIRDCSRVTGPRPCFPSQNQFLHNVFTGVSTPRLQDCRDETVGSATAGTADTWLDNTGATTSFPPGICLP